MEKRTLGVLLVEDSDGDALLVETMLREASARVRFDVVRATGLARIEELVSLHGPDVILLDLSLPDSDGLQSLARAREAARDLPIIVMTGLEDEESGRHSAELGAHGYLLKDETTPALLRRQIDHAIERARVTRELEMARQAATDLATRDPLTGVSNRLVLEDRLQRLVKQARRTGARIGVLMIDLDHFKSVNDTFGHGFGDEILRCVAKRLARQVRESDTVARLGGDEFVILLADLAHETDAARVAQKVVGAVREPIAIRGRRYQTAASVGIATYPSCADDPVALLSAADAAMYAAKRSGASGYRFFHEEMTEAADGRLAIERDLRLALERDEFCLLFEPLVVTGSGDVAGFEASVRWRHVERGHLRALDFLRVAEEAGVIVDIGAWALREACRQARAWQKRGRRGVPVSVDVSARQLHDPGFPERVEAALGEAGLPGPALMLEVAQVALTDDSGAALETLRRLADLDVRVAIDGFGSGASSFERISRAPVHCVKLDPGLVRSLPNDRSDTALISACVSLARGMGASCIAGGLATLEQWRSVRELGCEGAQGPLFSPPLSADEAVSLLHASTPPWSEKAAAS